VSFRARHCKEHGKAIEYVCKTDGMLICAHCAILGSHRADLGHKVGPVDTLVREFSVIYAVVLCGEC